MVDAIILNILDCMYGRIIIIKYGNVWQKYTAHIKNFINEDVKIFIPSTPVSNTVSQGRHDKNKQSLHSGSRARDQARD